jgi:hypothetical protein
MEIFNNYLIVILKPMFLVDGVSIKIKSYGHNDASLVNKVGRFRCMLVLTSYHVFQCQYLHLF